MLKKVTEDDSKLAKYYEKKFAKERNGKAPAG